MQHCDPAGHSVPDEPVVKWMSNVMLVCRECGRSTRHDVGVQYADGKEVPIRECLRCHTQNVGE